LIGTLKVKKQRFNVTGMSCAACQAAIERTVGKMDGVQSAVVNLLANTLTTEYDETKVTNEAICSRIAQIGYGATPEGAAPEAKTSQEKKAAEEAATRWRALVWSAIISVILMVLSMGSMQGWLPESLSGTRGRPGYAHAIHPREHCASDSASFLYQRFPFPLQRSPEYGRAGRDRLEHRLSVRAGLALPDGIRLR
jgi:cation transport ATPase